MISIANSVRSFLGITTSAEKAIAPDYITNLFKKYHQEVKNLHELNMTEPNKGLDDYIHSTHKQYMTYPVMRFVDGRFRPGIAIHIKGRETSQRIVSVMTLSEDRSDLVRASAKISSLEGVLVLHRRCGLESKDPSWVYNSGGNLDRAINQRHDQTDHTGLSVLACNSCPLDNGSGIPASPGFLEKLFKGEDPDFQLGIDPDYKLFSERVTTQENTGCLSFLSTKVQSVFSGLYRLLGSLSCCNKATSA